MTTIGGWLKIAERELTESGISSPHLDAIILLEKATHRTRENLMAHPDEKMGEQAEQLYRRLIDLRKTRTPLVHLTGSREFYGLDFEITPSVLTPRAETEQMVEWAIQHTPKNSRLIDVGTGSGAIGIAIAKHRPDLDIWASEVEHGALLIAQRNATTHNVKITFVQSNLFNDIPDRFSTVVTNLPYLQADAELMPEVAKEPAIALFGGEDGLDLYRRLFLQLPNHLLRGGYLFTECDPWQQPQLTLLAAKAGLEPIDQGYFIMGYQLK